MASIRRQGSAYEIRECRTTPRGPRQYALARFRDVLTPEVLDRAAEAAHRPFDARKLIADARRRGIPVNVRRTHAAARQLLGELRAGHVLEPGLAAMLKQALAMTDSTPLPEHLADAADWIGRSEVARGKALRGLLRAASRVVRSRAPQRERSDEPFPHFSSAESAS